MPDIETDDYKGKERRIGNARLRLSTADIRWIVTTLVGLLVGGTVAWTTLRADVVNNKDKFVKLEEQHSKDVKGIGNKLDELLNLVNAQIFNQGKFQQKVETSMEFIQKDIKEIKDNGQ